MFFQHAGGVGVGVPFLTQLTNLQMWFLHPVRFVGSCNIQTLSVSIFFRINTCETPTQLFILKDLCIMLSHVESTLTKKQGEGVSSNCFAIHHSPVSHCL